MQNITCAIVDDEPLAIQLLESYVSRIPFLTLQGKYSSALQALPHLKGGSADEKPPQLLFLDIQMPQLNGLELSQIIDPSTTRIVFTTAFSEYALESYKSQAVDYLLKPISFADFLGAAEKARQWFELQQRAAQADTAGEGSQDKTEDNIIYVRSEHRLVAIDLGEIEYVEAMKDYVMIHIAGRSTPILTITTMQTIADALPRSRFMRVHRSFIIALGRISLLEGDTVVIGNRHISISRQYRDQLLQYLGAKTVK